MPRYTHPLQDAIAFEDLRPEFVKAYRRPRTPERQPYARLETEKLRQLRDAEEAIPSLAEVRKP